MNNQVCKTRPQVNVNGDEPVFVPFSIVIILTNRMQNFMSLML